MKTAGASKFTKDFKNAASSVQEMVKKNEKVFSSFKQVGAVATAAGTAIAGGLGFAVAKAAGFESAMSEVKAISGATGSEFDKLSGVAREMGASTSFSASEAADGLKYMALAGWDTQQMMGGIEPVLHLAEAGALDLGRASDLVTDSMAAMGIEVQDLDGYLDKVAATSSNANTDIDALMEAFVIAGGTFKRLNVPLEESNAFLGILANRGFKGSEAGTALNAIMSRLTSGTGEAAKALDEIGVSAFDSEGNFRGMEEVMFDVKDALDGMDDETRAHYQTMIAGLNHGKTFSAMMDGLGDEYQDLKSDVENSNGALKEMRDIMKDNLQGALENLNSAFEEMMISIGEALLPAVKFLVAALQGLADWFNGLSDSTKSFIAISAAVVSGLLLIVGPIMLLIGFIPMIVAGFSALGTVLGAVGTALGAVSAPVLIVIAVIGALVAAIVIAYQKSERFREIVHAAFNAIKEVVMNVIGIVVDFIKEIWGGIVEWWQENNQMILEAAQNVWDVISTVISTVMNIIFNIMQALWPVIQFLIVDTWNAIKNVIQGAVDIITGVIQFFAALFTGDWGALWDAVKQILSGAVQALWGLVNLWFVGKILKVGKTFFNLFKGVFSKGWSVIKNIFTKSTGAVKNTVSSVFNAIKSFITTIMNGIKSVFSTVWNAIKSVISSVINAIKSAISSRFNTIKSVVTTVMNAIKSVMSTVWNGIKSVISSVTNAIKSTISRIFNSLKGIVSGAMNSVKSAISSGIKGALNVVKNIASQFVSAGRNIVSSIAKGITGAIGKVTGAIGKVTQKIRNFLPFSPAKEGALRDIMKVRISESIAESIRRGKSSAVGSMKDLSNSIRNEMNPVDVGDMVNDINRQTGQLNHTFNSNLNIQKQPVVIQVEGDAEWLRAYVNDNNATDVKMGGLARGY